MCMGPEANTCYHRANSGLIGWLFNGTSAQKGQFVPTAGEETGSVGYIGWPTRSIQCIVGYLTLHDNNVTQFA